MADLTRFDFHAKRFYFSEHVRVMSAEEVGQYLLLLVESWMGGKDASLPDNTALLARYARTTEVSTLVLKMFPVVETEHGPRRRNPTLFEEWSKAVQRTEDAKGKAAARWTKQPETDAPAADATAIPQQCSSNAAALLLQSKPAVTAYAHTNPLPNQTGSGPVRPGPSPTQPTNSEVGVVTHGATAPDPVLQSPNFKIFRSQFNTKLGRFGNLGNSKPMVEKYMDACSRFGAGQVSDAIHAWANDNTLAWIERENVGFPFAAFLKRLPDVIAEMQEDVTRDTAMQEAAIIADTLPTFKEPESMDAEIKRVEEEEQRKRDARAAKFAKPVADESTNALDYL